MASQPGTHAQRTVSHIRPPCLLCGLAMPNAATEHTNVAVLACAHVVHTHCLVRHRVLRCGACTRSAAVDVVHGADVDVC
jgi:hypothetical protein